MAEFCLECYNRIHKTDLTKNDVTLTRYLDFCEGCGMMKQTITSFRTRGFWFFKW